MLITHVYHIAKTVGLLDVFQELEAQTFVFRRLFNQSWNIGQSDALIVDESKLSFSKPSLPMLGVKVVKA